MVSPLVLSASPPAIVISVGAPGINGSKMSRRGQKLVLNLEMLCQTIGSIRTVLSYTGEKQVTDNYNSKLKSVALVGRSGSGKSKVISLVERFYDPGKCEWRKLIHCFIEMKCLFGPFCDDLCNPKHVFWLDFMESSTRIRRILRRNYLGSDHHGAAANYEDHVHQKHNEDRAKNPSEASTLAAEAISAQVEIEEDEHETSYLDARASGEHPGEIQTRSECGKRSPGSTDAPANSVFASAPIHTAVAPGYVPSEQDN